MSRSPGRKHLIPLLFLLILGGSLRAVLVAESAPLPSRLLQENRSLELAYVPRDAGLFLHADIAQLWSNPVGKSLRDADPKLFAEYLALGKQTFGETPDNLKTITLFLPKVKRESVNDAFGLVLTFHKPCNAEKLKAGFSKIGSKELPVRVIQPHDRMVVALFGLGEEFARPRPKGETGPLDSALADAAGGEHVLVAGATLANLPFDFRDDDVPEPLVPFKPLFRAESITARLSLAKAFTLDVRVKTSSGPKAIEAERALSLLATVTESAFAENAEDIARDSKLPHMRELVALFKAGATSAKQTQFSTVGEEARAVVKFPADLPFGGALFATLSKLKSGVPPQRSANNLKQIALAMHNYDATFNSFPPAAICDKNGSPLLSWRVLILPYIEHEALFKEFKLDEPWDSEHNKKLLVKMPTVYALPPQKPGETTTHYRVFVGNGAAFDLLKGNRIVDFTDGTSNTLLVVTATDAVPWSKPDELAFDPKADMTKLTGTVVDGRVQCAFADGSVRTFDKVPDRKTLNALITFGGGEVVDIP